MLAPLQRIQAVTEALVVVEIMGVAVTLETSYRVQKLRSTTRIITVCTTRERKRHTQRTT
jgi:hypothetical protein